MSLPPPAATPAAVPAPGGVATIAPGVLWVRMPLPFALDHINLWLLEDGNGWTLVDTGIGTDATRAAWERLSRDVLGSRPVRRIVCTHYHPDHVGLAGGLCRRWEAELHSSQTEWLSARMYTLDSREGLEADVDRFYLRAGVPDAERAELVARASTYKNCVDPVPTSFRRIDDGAELGIGGAAWRAVVGRGHSPEHVCLHSPERRLLVSGDQVLPSITPNVSVAPSEPDGDPVAEFLASLERLRAIPDDVLVLPSHGAPFRGLHRRLDALAAHHRERLDAALAACGEPATAWEVTRALFPRGLDPHQTTFAVGESVAHLNRLVAGGALRRRASRGGPDRWVRPA